MAPKALKKLMKFNFKKLFFSDCIIELGLTVSDINYRKLFVEVMPSKRFVTLIRRVFFISWFTDPPTQIFAF